MGLTSSSSIFHEKTRSVKFRLTRQRELYTMLYSLYTCTQILTFQSNWHKWSKFSPGNNQDGFRIPYNLKIGVIYRNSIIQLRIAVHASIYNFDGANCSIFQYLNYYNFRPFPTKIISMKYSIKTSTVFAFPWNFSYMNSKLKSFESFKLRL